MTKIDAPLTPCMKDVLVAMIDHKLWQRVDGAFFLTMKYYSNPVRGLYRVNPRTIVALRERYLISEDGPLHLPSCAMDFKLTTVGEYEASRLYDEKEKAKRAATR